MQTYNRNTRKWYAKLQQIRRIDEAIFSLGKQGYTYFSSKQLAEQTGLSYKTILRYIDKETLTELHKWNRKLSDILFAHTD